MSAPFLPPARRNALLDAIGGRRVAVVGDLILDRHLDGDSDRLSPEAPVPIVRVTVRREAPGGAANVAANLRAAGAVPLLVGAIGEDADGTRLRERLAAAGIATDGLVVAAGRPTTVKTRVLARSQQVVRIDEEETGPLHRVAMETVRSRALEALATAEAVVLEDYDKGVLAAPLIGELIGVARGRGIPVVADPKYEHFFAFGGATVLKPNRRELIAALGAGADHAGAEALLAACRRLAVDHLLVTLGAEGMALATGGDGGGGVVRIPSQAREVFDVSGAGDTVAAWLAAALAAGATVPEAAALANLAAGLEVEKAGVATVTPGELRCNV